MFLNRKIAFLSLSLAALAPLAAHADSSSLFANPQRVVWGHLANNIGIASVEQRDLVSANPCLVQASGKIVSDIQNSSAYDKALANYQSSCGGTSGSAPVFTIYGDYEAVPPMNSGNYSLAIAILVKYGKSTRLVWTTDPNHSPTANNDYVAHVGTSPQACPNIDQWEQQRANINNAQAMIVSELNNDARTCNSGIKSNGLGDGLGSQARSRRRATSNAGDPNAVQGASWSGAGNLR